MAEAAATKKTWSLKKVMSKESSWSLKKVMSKESSWSFKKVMSKENLVWPWPWKISNSFKWKRLDFQVKIIDDFVFKVMYVVEAIVLISTVCFFFLCCGCNF